MYAQTTSAITPSSALALTEHELLAQWGFTAEEITALLWLRQWYQRDSNDREAIRRSLRFLKLLVQSGELELANIR